LDLPFFYNQDLVESGNEYALNEETSKHVVQVLRMQPGEQLKLTDGKGTIVTAEITSNHKKACQVRNLSSTFSPAPVYPQAIAISLLKNAHRFEWFLEKATELGISEIFPLICSRTEKQHFRLDRMTGILTSSMLQSQQSWLPVLHAPIKFNEFLKRDLTQQKFIAHCEDDTKTPLHQQMGTARSKIVCIGPEGDFTIDEIYNATARDFIPVSLGNTRLRTETAGVVAATLLMIH
jgi:16S rRNA (uracil1498-N3)-methyltransferase